MISSRPLRPKSKQPAAAAIGSAKSTSPLATSVAQRDMASTASAPPIPPLPVACRPASPLQTLVQTPPSNEPTTHHSSVDTHIVQPPLGCPSHPVPNREPDTTTSPSIEDSSSVFMYDGSDSYNSLAHAQVSTLMDVEAPTLETMSYCSEDDDSVVIAAPKTAYDHRSVSGLSRAARLSGDHHISRSSPLASAPKKHTQFTPTPKSQRPVSLASSRSPPAAHSRDDSYSEEYDYLSAGIFKMSDDEVESRFFFTEEVGNGNWGSVWMCHLRDNPSRPLGLGNRIGKAATINGGVPGVVAIKLVIMNNDSQVVAQKVTALWGEMKIIRSLRHEPHPSIIQFEALILTPHYAMIVMPYLSHTIPVSKVSPEKAKSYFIQLTSAVAYLHERGITHNDIKPTNIVISHHDVPVLVDFGFANQHKAGDSNSFLSTLSWGTPEYLDPARAMGLPHDERMSDVWSLGITMYEVLVGRTPFEQDANETFETPEDLYEYYNRTRRGEWLGHYQMSRTMEHLLRYMICPDAAYRITALTAYHHPALQPSKAASVRTPPFIREVRKDILTSQHVGYARRAGEALDLPALKTAKSDVGVRSKKRRSKDATAPSGPAHEPAIKPATSAVALRPARVVSMGNMATVRDDDKPKVKTKTLAPKIMRTQPTKEELKPTAKVYKAQPLRVQELAKGTQPRVSSSENPTLARPSSAGQLQTAPKVQPLRRSSTVITSPVPQQLQVRPVTMGSTSPSHTREEAMACTMRSLEGDAISKQEAMERTMRALEGGHKLGQQVPPSPPRPVRFPSPAIDMRPASSHLARELDKKLDLRHSHGLEILATAAEYTTPPPRPRKSLARSIPALPRTPPRGVKAPFLDVAISTDSVFPPSLCGRSERTISGEYIPGQMLQGLSPSRRAKQSTAPSAIGAPHHDTNLNLEGLTRLADWAKTVERYVEEARRALAEGREQPTMPAMPEDLEGATPRPLSPTPKQQKEKALFHITPDSNVSTLHRLTTQAVLDYDETPTQVRTVKADKSHRARPAVSQVFKMFALDKDKSEPEKPLRGAPSAPTLRSSGKRIPTRKSESFLSKETSSAKRFSTAPAKLSPIASCDAGSVEELGTIASPVPPLPTPSALAPPGQVSRLTKPSSMISLRDKARALLSPSDTSQSRAADVKAGTLPRNARFPANIKAELVKIEEPSGRRPHTPSGISVRSRMEKRGGLRKLFGLMK